MGGQTDLAARTGAEDGLATEASRSEPSELKPYRWIRGLGRLLRFDTDQRAGSAQRYAAELSAGLALCPHKIAAEASGNSSHCHRQHPSQGRIRSRVARNDHREKHDYASGDPPHGAYCGAAHLNCPGSGDSADQGAQECCQQGRQPWEPTLIDGGRGKESDAPQDQGDRGSDHRRKDTGFGHAYLLFH